MKIKGKALIGPIIGVCGGILFVLTGFIVWFSPGLFFGSSFIYATEPLNLWMYLSIIFTFLWGILVILGAIFVFFNIKLGGILMIIFGILGLVGSFIPIDYWMMAPGYYLLVTLNKTFFYIDVILSVIGGILSLVLK